MTNCGKMDCACVCATSELYAATRLLSCLRSACIFCTAVLQPASPHPNTCMWTGKVDSYTQVYAGMRTQEDCAVSL